MLLILPHWAFNNWCYSLYQIRGNTSSPNNPAVSFTLRPSAEGVFETSLQLFRPHQLSHQQERERESRTGSLTPPVGLSTHCSAKTPPASDFQLLRAQCIWTSRLDVHSSGSVQFCQSFKWKVCFSFFFFFFSSFSSKSSLHNETAKHLDVQAS